jgi:gas vesicle protein
MNSYQRYGDYSQQQQYQEQIGPRAGSIVTSLLVGAGIGAALALLFTPKSGSELRSAIGRGCRRSMHGVTERTRALRERGSNLLGFNRGTESGTEVEKHYGQA